MPVAEQGEETATRRVCTATHAVPRHQSRPKKPGRCLAFFFANHSGHFGTDENLCHGAAAQIFPAADCEITCANYTQTCILSS
jgi:hypothetical protein